MACDYTTSCISRHFIAVQRSYKPQDMPATKVRTGDCSILLLNWVAVQPSSFAFCTKMVLREPSALSHLACHSSSVMRNERVKEEKQNATVQKTTLSCWLHTTYCGKRTSQLAPWWLLQADIPRVVGLSFALHPWVRPVHLTFHLRAVFGKLKYITSHTGIVGLLI